MPVLNSNQAPVQLTHAAEPDRFSLKPADQPDTWDIVDSKSGASVGSISRPADSPYDVELFNGKGGFMGVISGPSGIRYFGLPGSEIKLGKTRLTLQGAPITSHPGRQASAGKTMPPQTHTQQATILGAGLATRFERVSGNSTQYSKPGVPLTGPKTVIECIADHLAAHGFTHLIVNTYFKPESIKTSLARSAAKQVQYIDEAEPSGTAGGLRKMLGDPQYTGMLDESKPLLVVQGDAVTDADLSALMEAHIRTGALVTIGCQIVDEKDVDKFGIIVTDQSGQDGQSGVITGFQEKPKLEEAKSRLANTGFYIFAPAAYSLIRDIYQTLLASKQQTEVPFDFAMDIFPAILEHCQKNPQGGQFYAQAVSGYWSDIGNPTQYLESVHDIFAGKVGLQMPANPSQYYRNGIFYWEGAQALADREDAELSGNVVVATVFQDN